MLDLIYCAGGNGRFAKIATESGFLYGAQTPCTLYYPPAFTDQNWKKPNRAAYMATVAQYKPKYATVLDWERAEQLPEVIDWATEAAAHVSDSVIIIPKVPGGIPSIPRQINGIPVRLGYSAASTFSSTPVSVFEFRGWPVHCLGGSVATQRWLADRLDVRSADGNYIQRMALMCQVFSPGTLAKNRNWPQLREIGCYLKKDAMYLAFALTCMAVKMTWQGESSHAIRTAQSEYIHTHTEYWPGEQLSLF